MQSFTTNAIRRRHNLELKAILIILALLIPYYALARLPDRNASPLTTVEPPPRTNVAAVTNGGVASASSQESPYVTSFTNDGERFGYLSGQYTFWRDNTQNAWPDWLQIDFAGSKNIDEIDVFTVQDNAETPAEPTESLTFSLHGVTAFDVQYWSGSSWVTITGGSVTGNNKVWRKFTFAAVTTSKIRVTVNAALNSRSRLVEVEAWGTAAGPPSTNVAMAANGGVASASSQDSPFTTNYTNDGERLGYYDHYSFWRDSTNNVWPDWLQIDFNGSKTIDEIDVFTVQDNAETPAEPTESLTFSLHGITAFDVQYWDGSGWATVPGGSMTGNNKVWRKFAFAAITTTKIRVTINAALNSRSRVVELEAWGTDSNLYEDGMISTETGSTEAVENIRLFNRVYGTDFAVFGMGGLRDVGYGSLLVSNVVGTVRQANLYWHGPTSATYYNAGSSVLVNGVLVYGTPIGASDDNNWCCGYVNSQAYRADITSLVASSPNKYYTLSNFADYSPAYPVHSNQGFNPNGASLVVFYDDGNASNNRDISLYDGNDSNEYNQFDADGWNAIFPGIDYVSGQAILQLHVADGQSYVDPSVALNAAPFLSGYSFQGFTVPSGNGSFFFENLWDIRSFDITSYLHSGTNTLSITSPRPYGADALSIVLALVSVPAAPREVRITNARVSGTLNGTAQNALVGADIILNTSVVPAGFSGGTYSWTFTGPYTLVGGTANSASVTIRSTAPGAGTANVSYTRNGLTATGSVSFNAILPTLTIFTANAVGNVLDRGNSCSNQFSSNTTYTMGCYQNLQETGIVWSATAQIPNLTYISDPAQSGIKFKNAVSIFRKHINNGRIECKTLRTPSDSGWALDTIDPYNHPQHPPRFFNQGNSLQMADFDAPGTNLEGTQPTPFFYDAKQIDDHFETYVFFFSGNPSSPTFEYPQPLHLTNSQFQTDRIVWDFGGTAYFDVENNPVRYREQAGSSTTTTGPISAIGTNTIRNLQRTVTGALPPFSLCTGAVNTTNPIDGTRFFVHQQYIDFLGYEPDPGGWDFWTMQMTRCVFDTNCIYGTRAPGTYHGRRTAVAYDGFYKVASFNQTDPAMANPPGSPGFNAAVYNPAFIEHCYLGFLRRNSDPGGLAFWLNNLNTYADYQGIIDAFINSDEYRMRFGAANPRY